MARLLWALPQSVAGPTRPEATCAGATGDVMADGNVDAVRVDPRSGPLASAWLTVSMVARRPEEEALPGARLKEIPVRSRSEAEDL